MRAIPPGLIAAFYTAGIAATAALRVPPKPAQTNAVDPDDVPPQPESRQVRRHRLRMEAKRARQRGY